MALYVRTPWLSVNSGTDVARSGTRDARRQFRDSPEHSETVGNPTWNRTQPIEIGDFLVSIHQNYTSFFQSTVIKIMIKTKKLKFTLLSWCTLYNHFLHFSPTLPKVLWRTKEGFRRENLRIKALMKRYETKPTSYVVVDETSYNENQKKGRMFKLQNKKFTSGKLTFSLNFL